jgi:hypothetical protein
MWYHRQFVLKPCSKPEESRGPWIICSSKHNVSAIAFHRVGGNRGSNRLPESELGRLVNNRCFAWQVDHDYLQ